MNSRNTRRLHVFRLLVLTCGAMLVLLPSLSSAKGRKHPEKREQQSDKGPEWVPPGDWSTAARVNAFLGTYLEQNILAPLDAPAAPPRTALATLGVDFAAHLAAAQIPTDRALYADASNLWNMLGQVLDERERQQDALLAARSGSHAVNPLDMPASGVSGHYSWNLEAERARAEQRQDVQARLNALDKKDFFVSSKLRQWSDQTVNYRKSVQAAAINVSADQIRADAAAHTPAPAASTSAASPVPPVVKP